MPGLRPPDQDPADNTDGAAQDSRGAFLTGFMTNATNPKATLFFLAAFTTVVSDSTPLAVQALYGLWMCLVNASWFVLVSLVFSRATVRQRFLKSGHWFERAMGVVILGFAARLLFVALDYPGRLESGVWEQASFRRTPAAPWARSPDTVQRNLEAQAPSSSRIPAFGLHPGSGRRPFMLRSLSTNGVAATGLSERNPFRLLVSLSLGPARVARAASGMFEARD
ncbi:MAG: hypothetical protein BSR46_12780 [Candidatus Dactylopiibacterium carminicum]|nr:MAG: hypothetical protein BSR46_12780 [Candidatus Dactylopiibacterium carminicum]